MDAGFNATEKILLYYPTIDIPSASWVRQGIMYWDKIGSIVPQAYDNHLPPHLRYSDQLQPLYDAKLFRPFDPGELFNKGWKQNAVQKFETELFKILDSESFLAKLPEPSQRKVETELYFEKVNDYVYEKLKERNLVGERKDEFIYFEENTSLVYMAVLAKYLAEIDDQLTIPSTDLEDYQDLNFKPTEEGDREIICLRVEFRELLRVPADNVEIERVIDFRLKRNSELLNFRHQVYDKFEDEIKECETENEIKKKTIDFRQEVERNVKDLTTLLKDAKFQTVTGTLKSIFKAPHITTAITAATTAGAVGGSIESISLAGVAGLAGSAAIEIFDYFISRKNTKQDNLRKNAYSYLYLAEKEFGKATQEKQDEETET